MKYNPAFLTRDELIKSFVVRHTDLELILETIRQNTGNSNQHVLIIGPRGVGKTTLVLRTVAEVKGNEALAKKWYPIVFGEDSYEVCSPGEFWLEAIFHLEACTKLERWQRTYLELKSEQDEKRLRESALAQLMDFADEQGKRILLVVENLNMILGDQIGSDEAWVLRHTLTNEPRLMLLGTATSRFEQMENAGKAMFDLFKIQDLKPLNAADCRTIWKAITGEDLTEIRVRPIQILTGGNPRLLSIIANFAAKTSFRELMLDLTHLVDDHTEYFRSHLEALPPLERKVFVSLADLWDPLSAREVAEAARVTVNKTSSLLNRLISRGAVIVVEKKGRKKLYQVAERMYNIYHLMRRRGGPSSRIWAVVNFMISFYEREHLVRTVASIAEEACTLDRQQRDDHYLVYDTLLQKIPSNELKEMILKETPKKFFEMPDIPPSIKDSYEALRSIFDMKIPEESRATNRPDLLDRGAKVHGPDRPMDSASWIAFGDKLSGNADRILDAEKAYQEAINIDEKNAEAWRRLAKLLHENTDRIEEAEAAYRKAIELGPEQVWTWIFFGVFLSEKLARYSEAEGAFLKAIELEHEQVWAWLSLGNLLSKQVDRYPEAEKAYRKAVQLRPDYEWTWLDLGFFLAEKLRNYLHAADAYQKAIELAPNNAWAWGQLGKLLHEKLERYHEAEAAYRKAIELEPDNAWGWGQLGKLLHEKLERYQEAEAAYRKAIELDPDFTWAWAQLGSLLHEKLERFQEAESAYRKVIELLPNNAWPWAQLGRLLHEKLERYQEAESAYRKAIELKPNIRVVWVALGELLEEKLGNYKEAQKAYNAAIALDAEGYLIWEHLIKLQMQKMNDMDSAVLTAQKYIETAGRSADSLKNVSCTFVERGRREFYPQVTAWLEEATEKAPKDWSARIDLAYLQGAVGNWKSAIDTISWFLKNKETLENYIGQVTDFFIDAAASSYSEEALEALQKTTEASILEPLVIGLQIALGGDPAVAQEILEVGRDVAKRIETRKQQIKSISWETEIST